MKIIRRKVRNIKVKSYSNRAKNNKGGKLKIIRRKVKSYKDEMLKVRKGKIRAIS